MNEKDIEILKAKLARENAEFLEQQRQQGERSLEHYKALQNAGIAMLNGAIQFAVVTIRSLLILNGGAIVVVMALIGSIWAQDGQAAQRFATQVSTPAAWFIFGLAAAILTAAFSYFAQVLYAEADSSEDKKMEFGHRCRKAAIVLGFLSVGAFSYGAFMVLSIFAS